MEFRFLQCGGSFRLVLFPSWDLFSWKHKLEVKEVLLSEDIPGSTGLCTLSCFRERELARELRSPSLTSIIMGFKRLEGVPRYLICFLATQYILRNLLCSKTWLLINWPIIRLIYCWDIERRGCFKETILLIAYHKMHSELTTPASCCIFFNVVDFYI